MLTLVALLTLTTAPIPFDGYLEAEKTYELIADDVLAALRPPSLKLPHTTRAGWSGRTTRWPET